VGDGAVMGADLPEFPPDHSASCGTAERPGNGIPGNHISDNIAKPFWGIL